ncbi:type II toxin-antitoxin system RelE/ParE family toxin [Wolbachia endosymbiont of Atemnus politus]|nr:type II toxin-antitoxin system RelE/ParE family toxin [Wolbachia endosymbiont of Atemnus politus]NSM56634.1 type II toxin-antitoxin system RelE/ParE family toxin [Wolbachia endosymbiont of Atemnus politus]NSX83793.1 type II toxin-antitoxin system mRNA interferase toxin, RelE/StbE family [Wolbachia endosymbiont of Atemnus politus]
MKYDIVRSKNFTERDFPNFPKTIRSRITKAINERLTTDPIKFGKPLRGRLKGYRRIRVGNYRIIYTVNIAKHKVFVATAGHRDTIYEQIKLSDLL